MDVKPEEIQDLLEFFSKNTYRARDTQPKVHHVMERCLGLFGLDYKYSIISNQNGDLSTNYPSSLVILETEKTLDDCIPASGLNGDFVLPSLNISSDGGQENNGVHPVNSSSFSTRTSNLSTSQDNSLEIYKIKELFTKARFARCRARFPVPVILYNNKHICRSATLSGGPEIYGRSSIDYLFSGGADYKIDTADGDIVIPETQSEWQLFDRVRSQDIRLLKTFQVHTIVDLMVEKKKVKFGVNVTSSEKVDKEHRYSEFNLISLPYPGCEFFKQYRDNNYDAEHLIFEWNQGHVDAEISVPNDETSASLNLDWSQYRRWDLVRLTQNYLKLLLTYIKNGSNKGLLIHCISGWDRTPLFVSLIRLSLWADGAVHKSLNAEQILYLTLAYDWLLFGHNLEDRLNKGEEILYFCFYFLKHIANSDFSVDSDEDNEEEPTNPIVLASSRNDSDLHLDGVLLDGEGSQTSPEGSNWSLNSCSSSQSSKNQDHPPTYFQVTQDSWEDCNGDQQPTSSGLLSASISNNQPIAQARSSTTSSPIASSHVSNGSNGIAHPLSSHPHPIPLPVPRVSGGSLNNSKSSSRSNGSSNSPTLSRGSVNNGSARRGRTSPVAVPVPNRNIQHRTDSNSSASIGSWQLITGTGSLREAISSSDPGSAFSHPSISDAMVDFKDASESSCTLVEELGTPMNSRSTSSPFGNGASRLWRSTRTIEEELQQDDNVFLPASFNEQSGDDPDDDLIMESGFAGGEVISPNENNSSSPSGRRDRLQAVRKHFYSVYSTSVGLQSRHYMNDNSSGLSVLFGNIATKVGIRGPGRNPPS